MKNTTFRAAAVIATTFAALSWQPQQLRATNYIILASRQRESGSGVARTISGSVMRIQECYGGSLFPQQTITISAIELRPSAAVGFAFSTTISKSIQTLPPVLRKR